MPDSVVVLDSNWNNYRSNQSFGVWLKTNLFCFADRKKVEAAMNIEIVVRMAKTICEKLISNGILVPQINELRKCIIKQ